MPDTGAVVVHGATGHTGRFVVAELVRRGVATVVAGRDGDRLAAVAARYGSLEVRTATVGDATSLDRLVEGAAAVVNCAGPFADTARPLIEASLRAGAAYVDVAAEIEAVASVFTDHGRDARAAGVLVVPAMAFFGGLGDLLVTAAAADWTTAEEVRVVYGLSGWRPTPGTRRAGQISQQRRAGRRLRFTGGVLRPHDDAPQQQTWTFPPPNGPQEVFAEFTMTDVVTIPSHLDVPEVSTSMTVGAARELADPRTPGPEPVDDSGRSGQTFVVDVVVRTGSSTRRATATGQDIYAVTAPLVAEAVQRLLDGRTRTTGVASAGAAFDAADFLASLARQGHLDVSAPSTLGRHEDLPRTARLGTITGSPGYRPGEPLRPARRRR
ncbi:saccharopine dehydrogenase family protein [Kineococcus siccus]|uniref:saccharopine dehydrogenase family protein n=1 Tax=Kineococcus siccus TaxID=2696567 RepID=UPI0030B829E7